MNSIADTDLSTNFTLEQMQKNKIKPLLNKNYWGPVQNPAVFETLPSCSDYFDFLRKHQPVGYDSLPLG